MFSAVCDNSHLHAPWGRLRSGVWATAVEAEYPSLLCVRYLRHLLTAPIPRGAVALGPLFIVRNRAMAVSSVRQPRSRRCLPLAREFKEVVTCKLLEFSSPLQAGQCLTTVFNAAPLGSKLIRRSAVGMDGSVELFFGVLWLPMEFDHQASIARHPFQVQAPLPDPLL